MQIRRMTATFGKLHSSELSLAPGLNLIYAPNESGKSTWAHLLCTMFYGLNTRDRGPLADKNRFAPWSGGAMQGRLDITDDNNSYAITRTTRRANSPMGEFRCTYSDTANDVPGVDSQNCGEYFLGIPKEVFQRSAFIGQNTLAVDHSSELEQRIVSLITAGEEEISYSDSYDRLKKQLNRRKANSRVGQIPALEREIDSLQQQLNALEDLQTQATVTQQRLEQLAAKRRNLLAQQGQWEQFEAQQAFAAYREAQQAAQSAQSKADLLDELTVHLPDQPTLSRLSGQAAAAAQAAPGIKRARELAQHARQSADATQARLEAHQLYPCTEAEIQQKRRDLEPPTVPSTPWVATVLLFAGVLMPFVIRIANLNIHSAPSYILLAVSFVLFLAACGMFLRHRLRRRRAITLQAERAQQLTALEEAVASYHALQEDASAAHEQARQTEATAAGLAQSQHEQVLSLLREVQQFQSAVTDLSGIQLALSEAQARRAETAEAHRAAQSAALRCQILQEHLPDTPRSEPETIAQPTLSKTQLQELLTQVDSSIRAEQTRLDTLTGQIRTFGDSDDMLTHKSQLQEQLARYQQEYDALTLAMEVLSQANTTLQNRFSPALGARAAEIFHQITHGKYSKVLLSRDFSLAAEEPDDSTMHSVQLLSQGAADQLYLATRLAICDMVLPAEHAVPLILDDALVSFDDDRLHAALDYLVQEGQKRQILLFTCQKREQAYLAGREGVTFLSL